MPSATTGVVCEPYYKDPNMALSKNINVHLNRINEAFGLSLVLFTYIHPDPSSSKLHHDTKIAVNPSKKGIKHTLLGFGEHLTDLGENFPIYIYLNFNSFISVFDLNII